MGSHPPPPRQAKALIRAYTKNITPGTIVTERDPSLLWELVLCIIQQGRLPRLMGGRSDPRLDIMGLLDNVASMPAVWVIHGMQDSIVCFPPCFVIYSVHGNLANFQGSG